MSEPLTRFTGTVPSATDQANIEEVSDAILNIDANAAKYLQGLLASRPAAGTQGRHYWATDTNTVYYDTGSAWKDIIPDGFVTASKVADALKPSAGAAAGTEALRAIGSTAATVVAGNDARLTDTRTPSDNSVTAAKVHTSLKPSSGAAAGTEALRALGTTASTAAAGNDSRLSDTRTPSNGSVTPAKLAMPGAAIMTPVASSQTLTAGAGRSLLNSSAAGTAYDTSTVTVTAGTARVTAQRTGLYLVMGDIAAQAVGGTATFAAYLRKNGTTDVATDIAATSALTTTSPNTQLPLRPQLLSLTAGDYLQLEAQAVTNNVTVEGGSFIVLYLGPAS